MQTFCVIVLTNRPTNSHQNRTSVVTGRGRHYILVPAKSGDAL